MCVVIDLDAVCLICLQPSKTMQLIFTVDEDDPEMQIAQKISILSELKIDQNNQTLPRKICNKCMQDLKAAWRFRKNCQAAVTIFHTIVKLDGVQSENAATNELAENQIKVPHGLKIKRLSVDNQEEGDKKSQESLILEKDESVEFIITNEELESDSCKDESQDVETSQFQIIEETEEIGAHRHEEYEDALVEYITEDVTTEESTTKIDRKIFDKYNFEEKPVETSKHCNEIGKRQMNAATYLKRSKPSTRERSGKQNILKNEIPKCTNVVQTKTKGKFVIDSKNNSIDINNREVREVKTRKRKSLSPETKTPKICEICGNSYRYQHALNAHMRRHYNDKQFPCECCDKAFVSNVELRRHMRVHTGQKPYACQYCERRFSDFGSRIKHERTHTGERPYHCVTCGKSFAYPHVLSVHVLTHTGEKRFRCDHCTKGFTKKAYLVAHVNQHHSESKNFSISNDDTMDNSQNTTENIKECVYTSELANETIGEVEKYDEDSYQEDGEIISAHSLTRPKVEADDESEIQEIIEDHPEEFSIRVR